VWEVYHLTLNDILDMDIETYLDIKESLRPYDERQQAEQDKLKAQMRQGTDQFPDQ